MRLPSVYESLDYESIKPLKKYHKYLKLINESKDYLRAKTDQELKEYWQKYINKTKKVNPNNFMQTAFIFSIAREVTYRITGKFQYDVQVLGGLAAIDRNAVQMSTGSGKTLTLILPSVVFGLTHKGTYVLTVNDYLSKRDWEETKAVYEWFDLTTAYTDNNQPERVQRKAFESDIIYCTNSTLGFAYLNSALASDIGQDIKIIHRPLYSAIIDECDEILMDDARNPLIIADGGAPSNKPLEVEYDGQVHNVQEIVDKLKTLQNLKIDDDDPSSPPYIDDDSLQEIKSKLGVKSDMFNNAALMHVIYSAVQAIFNNHNYTDYIVMDHPDEDTGSRIVLIDKATGRLAHGRTMNDGMHAFLEMKEGVYSGQSTKSSIQITYQILFNLFETIAGVSGTLGSSYKEFTDIYGMGLVIIPDRLPNKLTQKTRLYTTSEKLNTDLLRLIRFFVSSHRPILIGAKSDIHAYMISNLLRANNVEHKLLVSTDKNEAEVVNSAGKPGSIVVTTDIMGRGTDIKPEDVDGERGLVVLQVGLRPNSRVERQFAGRAARQGQPGHYERLLSLPDLLDIDLPKDDRKMILDIWHANRKLIEYHHSDILLGGRNPDYDSIVGVIDKALVASESRYSSSRVEDFKAYSIVDLMQISIVKKMDDIRLALKESISNDTRAKAMKRLIELLAENSIDKDAKKRKKLVKEKIKEYRKLDEQELRIASFNYVHQIMGELIPRMREHSEEIINTTKLAGMVQYQMRPEDMMIKLLQDFLATQDDILLFDPNMSKLKIL